MEELHENNDLHCDKLPSLFDITVLKIYRAVNSYIKDTLNISSSISVRDIYHLSCRKGVGGPR